MPRTKNLIILGLIAVGTLLFLMRKKEKGEESTVLSARTSDGGTVDLVTVDGVKADMAEGGQGYIGPAGVGTEQQRVELESIRRVEQRIGNDAFVIVNNSGQTVGAVLAPSTIAESERVFLSPMQIKSVQEHARSRPHNLLLSNISRELSEDPSISLNDVRLLGLNADTAPLVRIIT
tara:strand:- start:930 stop:1460 length:531 start_codon:yes stop_codon:yes gene_type:complete